MEMNYFAKIAMSHQISLIYIGLMYKMSISETLYLFNSTTRNVFECLYLQY